MNISWYTPLYFCFLSLTFFCFHSIGLKKIDCESIKERYGRTCFAPLSRLLGTALQCFTGSTCLTRWRGSNSFSCRCVSFVTSFGRCVAWGGTERNRFWFTDGIVWAVLCVCVSTYHLFFLVSFRLIRCQPSPSTHSTRPFQYWYIWQYLSVVLLLYCRTNFTCELFFFPPLLQLLSL